MPADSGVALNYSDLGDSDLLGLSARGDGEAFAAIYSRCGRSVYRYALASSGDRATAEEVTQETFLAVLKRPEGFDPARGELLPYLLGTARRLLLHAWRERVGEVDLEPEWGDCVADDTPGPLELLDRERRVDAVRGALAALPPPYRETVALCDIEELSYAQAAAVLGVAEGTIRSRLFRGRALLARRLGAGERMETKR